MADTARASSPPGRAGFHRRMNGETDAPSGVTYGDIATPAAPSTAGRPGSHLRCVRSSGRASYLPLGLRAGPQHRSGRPSCRSAARLTARGGGRAVRLRRLIAPPPDRRRADFDAAGLRRDLWPHNRTCRSPRSRGSVTSMPSAITKQPGTGARRCPMQVDRTWSRPGAAMTTGCPRPALHTPGRSRDRRVMPARCPGLARCCTGIAAAPCRADGPRAFTWSIRAQGAVEQRDARLAFTPLTEREHPVDDGF